MRDGPYSRERAGTERWPAGQRAVAGTLPRWRGHEPTGPVRTGRRSGPKQAAYPLFEQYAIASTP
jgi:hypothetical protein